MTAIFILSTIVFDISTIFSQSILYPVDSLLRTSSNLKQHLSHKARYREFAVLYIYFIYISCINDTSYELDILLLKAIKQTSNLM